MVKYRNNVEIVGDILAVARDGALKTQIMYRANLSFKLLEKYMSVVLNAGLVMRNHDGRYLITEKGLLFLEKFRGYKRHARSLRRQSKRVRDVKAALDRMCLPLSLDDDKPVENDEKAGKNKNRVKCDSLLE